MNENPFKNQPTSGNDSNQETKENFTVRVETATPKDWEAYKKLRLMAITGKDTEMLDSTSVKRDLKKSDEDWQKDLAESNDSYWKMAWTGNEAVGMAQAINRGSGVWHLVSVYSREDLRGKGIGKKLYIAHIDEIRKRGGLKIITGIKYRNARALGLALSFGFKKVGFPTRVIRTKSLVIPMIFQGLELDLIPPRDN